MGVSSGNRYAIFGGHLCDCPQRYWFMGMYTLSVVEGLVFQPYFPL